MVAELLVGHYLTGGFSHELFLIRWISRRSIVKETSEAVIYAVLCSLEFFKYDSYNDDELID